MYTYHSYTFWYENCDNFRSNCCLMPLSRHIVFPIRHYLVKHIIMTDSELNKSALGLFRNIVIVRATDGIVFNVYAAELCYVVGHCKMCLAMQ